MKKIIVALLLSIVNYQLSIAQIGTWHNYLSYHDIQDIQAADNYLFVQASNALYQYNKKDQSIITYDKCNGLSDNHITHIRWFQQAKRLVIIYENSNIDLLDINGNVTNISDIYTKSITGGKNINNIYFNGIYAFLSTEFGIVKLNVKTAEISETYKFESSIVDVTIEDNILYAKDASNTVWKGDMTKNLIDPNNWTITTTYPSFDDDPTDYNENIELVQTLKPGGPDYNEFYESKFVNGKLYTTGGEFRSGQIQKSNPGIIQIFDGNNWTVYPTNINETTGFKYEDINCIDVDPTNPNRVMAGGRTGLYEFNNGVFKTVYYKENSPLRPAVDRGTQLSNNYTLVNGIKFDANGNLWVINSQAKDVNLMKLTKDGKWQTYTKNDLFKGDGIGRETMRCMMYDSRGLIWFVNTQNNLPSIHCYDPSTDILISQSSFINQDGSSYDRCYPYGVAEDLSGNIWIVTSKGPFYIKKEDIGKENVTLYQEKVPRNDGTDLADYLLANIFINCITVDGAGRKWFATKGNGAFLISEDNMTQIQHFTTDNSKLISNNINSISINPQSGEVFFLTDKGLCSYISDATEAATEMTKDNVWAYPNPVNPGYTGIITIVGLTLNADVKILASNGALVAEGRSNGGTFIWNGCDRNGNPVASGVYMVATATNSGDKGTVCKIAIVR